MLDFSHAEVVVSDHAIGRLRLRVGRCRRWNRRRIEGWIAGAVQASTFVIDRSDGESYVHALCFGKTLYLAVHAARDGRACLVKTVLPRDFASNNLTRARH